MLHAEVLHFHFPSVIAAKITFKNSTWMVESFNDTFLFIWRIYSMMSTWLKCWGEWRYLWTDIPSSGLCWKYFFFGWISPLTWRNSDILEIVVMGFLCSTIVKSRMGVQSWNITYLMLLRKPQIICHMGISGRTRAENRWTENQFCLN